MPSQDAKLQIRCSEDTKTSFKILAAKIDEDYEETLKRLLELEKEYSLKKREKGLVVRL